MIKQIRFSLEIPALLLVVFLFCGTSIEGAEPEEPVEVLIQFSEDKEVDRQLQVLKKKLDVSNLENIVQFKYTNVLGGALLRLPPEKLSLLMDQDQQIFLLESDKTMKRVPWRKSKSLTPRTNSESSPSGKKKSDYKRQKALSDQQKSSPLFTIEGKHAGKVSTSNVNVAVIDTGIDHGHPELDDNVKGGVMIQKQSGEGGLTIDTSPEQWMDKAGHGTHVAGIIAAENNDRGVVGIAPHANVYGIRLKSLPIAPKPIFLSEVAAGIDWLADDQASPNMDVVNMSIGTRLPINVKQKKQKLRNERQKGIDFKKHLQKKLKKHRKKLKKLSRRIKQLEQSLETSKKQKKSRKERKKTLEMLRDRRKKLKSNIQDTREKIRAVEKRIIKDRTSDIERLKRSIPKKNILRNVLRDATEQGTTFVVAAGNANAKIVNEEQNYKVVPAGFSDVITVSALTKNKKFARSFSNFGSSIDLTAPGAEILSTIPEHKTSTKKNSKTYTRRYGQKSGTSMSAPYVTGTAAQLISAAKAEGRKMTPDQVKRILKQTGIQPREGWANDFDDRTEPLVNPDKASKRNFSSQNSDKN